LAKATRADKRAPEVVHTIATTNTATREHIPGASDILVVEDDPTLRHLIAESLVSAGYRVVGARDGADALQVLDRVTPWLILLDLRMPVMKGEVFAHEVRRRQVHTKIVVMTAALDAEHLAREAEADDCLAKPFQMAQLFACVERHRPAQWAAAS
jgi:two-component system response regulator FlrC